MKELFEAIRITDLDIDLTQPSQEKPGFQHLYLKLSAAPPREWVEIFEQQRRFPCHSRWRNAWVEGAHIVIDCLPEELEHFALNHLKEDVAQANQSFVKWVAKNDAAIVRQLKEKAAARKQLEKLRAKLKFDQGETDSKVFLKSAPLKVAAERAPPGP